MTRRREPERGEGPPTSTTVRPRFDLVRRKRVLHAKSVQYLSEYVKAAETGEISGFAICAIGPTLATWRGYPPRMTRKERINLIGQLMILVHELSTDEVNSD